MKRNWTSNDVCHWKNLVLICFGGTFREPYSCQLAFWLAGEICLLETGAHHSKACEYSKQDYSFPRILGTALLTVWWEPNKSGTRFEIISLQGPECIFVLGEMCMIIKALWVPERIFTSKIIVSNFTNSCITLIKPDWCRLWIELPFFCFGICNLNIPALIRHLYHWDWSSLFTHDLCQSLWTLWTRPGLVDTRGLNAMKAAVSHYAILRHFWRFQWPCAF